jgi:hypothetical protein
MENFFDTLTVPQLKTLAECVKQELAHRKPKHKRFGVKIENVHVPEDGKYEDARELVIAALDGVRSKHVRVDVDTKTATITFNVSEELFNKALGSLERVYGAQNVTRL